MLRTLTMTISATLLLTLLPLTAGTVPAPAAEPVSSAPDPIDAELGELLGVLQVGSDALCCRADCLLSSCIKCCTGLPVCFCDLEGGTARCTCVPREVA